MDIRKIARHCLLEFGTAKGEYPLTKLEYYVLSISTRKENNMSPEEYLAGIGLNITFEIL